MTVACSWIQAFLINFSNTHLFKINIPLCMYGDPPYLLAFFFLKSLINSTTSSLEFWNEWSMYLCWMDFRGLITYFKCLDFKKNLKNWFKSSWENARSMCLVTQSRGMFIWEHNIYLFWLWAPHKWGVFCIIIFPWKFNFANPFTPSAPRYMETR